MTAMDPDASELSAAWLSRLEVAAVFVTQLFLLSVTMASVLAALSFSANTAFGGLSTHGARDCVEGLSASAVFLLRGRRLLFSHGIYALNRLHECAG